MQATLYMRKGLRIFFRELRKTDSHPGYVDVHVYTYTVDVQVLLHHSHGVRKYMYITVCVLIFLLTKVLN